MAQSGSPMFIVNESRTSSGAPLTVDVWPSCSIARLYRRQGIHQRSIKIVPENFCTAASSGIDNFTLQLKMVLTRQACYYYCHALIFFPHCLGVKTVEFQL